MAVLWDIFESALPCPCRHTGRCPDDDDPPEEDDDENHARAQEREETDRRSA